MSDANFLDKFGKADQALRDGGKFLREAENHLNAAAQELHDFEKLLELTAAFAEQHGCACTVIYDWNGKRRYPARWSGCTGNCSRLYELLDKYGARASEAKEEAA